VTEGDSAGGEDPMRDGYAQLALPARQRTVVMSRALSHERSEAVVERLDVRDKCVAGGLSAGTALVMVMLGLAVPFLVALAAAAPVLLLAPVRERLFRSDRETLQAYYVAWLYGPLGWGLYRGVRWAQILGVGVLAAVLVAVM